MELHAAGVVVTGAGSGIGAALARRFAAEGARVVVNDLDPGAAQAVADELGALAVPGDAASDTGAAALVAAAHGHLGAVDLFCANAGIASEGGPDAPDEAWQRSWEVNVLGHVHAARHLLPHWLERGRGHLLATVSAAGLLSMPGSAPYSVTKHAALAFAEWLAFTYSGRGITVQALCPQGVRTPMLEATGRAGDVVLRGGAITAEEVADAVVAALPTGRFLVLPHPEVADYVRGKAQDVDAWLAGMARLSDKIG